MNKNKKLEKFRQNVKNKYQIYNSLFMSLPYDKVSNIGMLLPFLLEESKKGYEAGKSPVEIVDRFFSNHTELKTEQEKIDLLFRLIQYVERQVALFDSIEDSAFSSLYSNNDTGTIRNLVEIAERQGKMDELLKGLQNFAVKIVFTAHPTQFYSNEVQSILHDLHIAIKEDNIRELDTLLQQLGMTSFVNKEKPTPYDEALSIIYYLRYVYYDALGELYHEIKDLMGTSEVHKQLFQLGFWPGGDRDGNPYVTAEMTWKVAKELRLSVLKSYYSHLKKLRKRLTFPTVSQLLAKVIYRLYENIFLGKLDFTADEFRTSIREIKQVLITENNGLFVEKIDDLLGRIDLFGVYFAALDIRQNVRVHNKAMQEIFRKEFDKDFTSLPREEKLDLMLNRSLQLNPDDFEDELVRDTLKNIYQLKELQRINGEESIFRYIISESIDIYDVLNVYALFKYCDYKDEDIHFDIIPLFETIEGFTAAEETMNYLYNLPVYRDHLKRRGNRQYIMVGFSDGTKDAGYIKGNWDIYLTKETLTRVSQSNGIEVVFFDGRGGPPARGGGRSHEFYAAQGKKIANHQLELTIQGQTITSVFGAKEQATYNFEQLLTSGVTKEVLPKQEVALEEWQRKLLNELAGSSYLKYKALKEHPRFISYLEEISTLKYYGRTNIGSRPTKRSDGKLVFEDLRAIPFVGSWSLLKQNVPGYFGVGTALKKLQEEGRLDEAKKLYQEGAFFRTLINNSMMSMSKTYFPLTQYLKKDPVYGEFWQILYDEFLLTRELVLEISENKELMENEQLSKSSIELREEIVLPLLTVQQYALEKIQQNDELKEYYEKIVTRALFGNINASRNSA